MRSLAFVVLAACTQNPQITGIAQAAPNGYPATPSSWDTTLDTVDFITLTLAGDNGQSSTIDATPGDPFAFPDVAPGQYHFELDAVHGSPDGWFNESMGTATTANFEVGTGDVDVGTLTIIYQPEY